MRTTHKIEEIYFDNHYLIMNIDGREWKFELSKVSSKLARATEIQRSFFKVSPSGYGIHWPLIDEDLSVDALLNSI